jgi:arabinogalactan endo-1,4-beta-galactosidase
MTVTKATNLDTNFILSQDISTIKMLESQASEIIKSENKYKEVLIKACSQKIL